MQGRRRHATKLLAPAWGSVSPDKASRSSFSLEDSALKAGHDDSAVSPASPSVYHQPLKFNPNPPLFLVLDQGTGFLVGR